MKYDFINLIFIVYYIKHIHYIFLPTQKWNKLDLFRYYSEKSHLQILHSYWYYYFKNNVKQIILKSCVLDIMQYSCTVVGDRKEW